MHLELLDRVLKALVPEGLDHYGLSHCCSRDQHEISCYGCAVRYPKGSPTTKNAIVTSFAPLRISSLEDSTISRSAMMTGRP